MPSFRPEISARHRLASSLGWVALLLVSTAVTGCAPEIGDACTSALDCSASATRLCDLTQTGGYCTLEGCSENTCPEEAVCVQFGRRFEGQSVDRLSRTYCMYKCDSRSDCRSDEGYDCFSAETFGASAEADVLGNPEQKFCASIVQALPADAGAGPPEPDPGPSAPDDDDAGMSMPAQDAAMSMPEDDAGAPS